MGGVIFYMALIVLSIVSWWKIFEKAGEPGWVSIVPIYNIIVLLKIIGRPTWWILLYFIPIINFIIAVILLIEFSKRFGKGVGFAIGLTFLPFIFGLILAFGDAEYESNEID